MATDGSGIEENNQTFLSTLPKDLPLDFLRAITDQFSQGRIISAGPFGTVYKGIMPDGQVISVNKLVPSASAEHGKAFTNEVQDIMALQHKNIAKLVGYCYERHKQVVQNNRKYVVADVFECLLCYEYLPMGSLARNVLGQGHNGMLNWATRFQIIKGICDGLLFLHSIPIIHMDLRPENILLDHCMTPKIAEFGISRLFGQEETRLCTQNHAIDSRYLPPEYMCGGQISTHSDIYSLGLLILDITTRENTKNEPLAELFGRGNSSRFFMEARKKWTDSYISSIYCNLNANDLLEVKLCIEIGLECLEIDREKRPSIASIIERLCKQSGKLGVGNKYSMALPFPTGFKRA